jgi:hypothetical protein
MFVMIGQHEAASVVSALTPAPVVERPARFEAWPDDIKTRAFEFWSTVAVCSAPRTESLLAQESGEGVAVPAASTIRRWATEDGWAAQRDQTLDQTQRRTFRQLQATSLMAIALAQQTLLDAMTGLLDDAPYGGSGRIKAAEAMLRLAERSGIQLVVTEAALPPPSEEGLSTVQRSQRMRERFAAQNAETG